MTPPLLCCARVTHSGFPTRAPRARRRETWAEAVGAAAEGVKGGSLRILKPGRNSVGGPLVTGGPPPTYIRELRREQPFHPRRGWTFRERPAAVPPVDTPPMRGQALVLGTVGTVKAGREFWSKTSFSLHLGMEQVPTRRGETLEVPLQLPRTPSPLPALTAAPGERMREDFPGQLNVSALHPPVSTRMWHRPCLTTKKENCTLELLA
ncbi:uncharacterized protein [Manis javanica]|uniref:uncharacterized protein n=1 Tax=Manis javanica TaxID=9974 RepID=UPI003C6D6E82